MNVQSQNRKRVLIVDDDPTIRELVANTLQDDFTVSASPDGSDLLEIFQQFRPDIVLLDIELPGPDGFSLCRRLKTLPEAKHCQLVMLSARDSRKDLRLAYDMGADDYLIKPVTPANLLARLQLHANLLDARLAAQSYSEELCENDSLVAEILETRKEEQQAIQDASIFLLTKFAEARDENTGAHLVRISHYSLLLASALVDHADPKYRLSFEESLAIGRMSILHDLGKISIPDAVLLKPGRFNEEERLMMQRHTTIGAEILEDAMQQFPSSQYLRVGAIIAKYHHERWDGAGYPTGLAGHDIPLAARVVAIADAFDAMTMERPYRWAKNLQEARQEIIDGRGSHFDPVLVDLFLEQFPEVKRIHETFAHSKQSGHPSQVEFPTQLFGQCDNQPRRLRSHVVAEVMPT